MKEIIISASLGVILFFIYENGPEWMQYHHFRVYKEIKSLQHRVDQLESKK